MAGVRITIAVEDGPIKAALERLARRGQDRRPALKDIGQAMVQATRARFRAEVDPEGSPWAALNPEYAKAKRGRKILQGLGFRGGLIATIVWQLDGDRVVIGTNRKYAAIHQFGGRIVPRRAQALRFLLGGKPVFVKHVDIPARPFLGVSRQDEREVLAIVRDHLNEGR